ncbi:MAG: polysaccharide pyruvyl transferase family protein [Terracidiphilus sp.]
MKVYAYLAGDRSNFGDDLNRWLWSRLLGSSLDVDDGTVVLGIGTTISRELLPSAKRYIVLSSGVGYGAIPADFGGPNWEVLAVRGPLTAAVLNLSGEKAITDGAALLRLLPECEPLPASERRGVAFMPNFERLALGNWRQACEAAGFEFLNPFADSEQTVQRIRRAKLVIADAMHAAIVADALRVPWIPVVLSPQNSSFKWFDWTMSLNLPYRPTKIPASTLMEAVRNTAVRFIGPRYYFEDRNAAEAIEHYRRVARLKSRRYWPLWRWCAMKVACSIPMRIFKSAPLRGFKKRQDEERADRAAEQLRRVAEMPSYLSDEPVLMSKVEQIGSLLSLLRR